MDFPNIASPDVGLFGALKIDMGGIYGPNLVLLEESEPYDPRLALTASTITCTVPAAALLLKQRDVRHCHMFDNLRQVTTVGLLTTIDFCECDSFVSLYEWFSCSSVTFCHTLCPIWRPQYGTDTIAVYIRLRWSAPHCMAQSYTCHVFTINTIYVTVQCR